MKRSTAIGHLVEIGETADEAVRLHRDEIGWPLQELWVSGDLLSLTDTLEWGSVVLTLDIPPEEVPNLARHPTGEWVGYMLRLGKRPLQWSYRPTAWPAWNHDHRRVARVWSRTAGLDGSAIEALRSRRLDTLEVAAPTPTELAEQLKIELPISQQYLATILDQYWDRDWRREHKGQDESPEDHLWRAATAVQDITNALTDLRA